MELQQIQRKVENHFGFFINVKSRKRHLVDARKMYFALCREFTKKSLTEIGRSLEMDHSSVLHNSKSCKDLIKTDIEFAKHYITLFNQVSLLKSNDWKIPKARVPKHIHPGYLRYADKKSIRKIFNKRGPTSKQRYELH